MIRILNAEPYGYDSEARTVLQSIGELAEARLSQEELPRRVGDVDVLIVRLGLRVDRQVIDVGSGLRAIVSATTGLDHIDVDYARSRGVSVLSLQDETEFLKNVRATAEHTWALLLALVRRIPFAFRSVCEGEWDRDRFRGHDLYGKRFGVVGLGRIGEMVARYAMAFGLQVHAYDPLRQGWPPDVVREPTLDDLLRVAEILSLHAPLNDQTRALIGSRELNLLPAGAILVNTARGDLIDAYALLDTLSEGKLAGAALDVIPGERDDRDERRAALVEYARKHSNLLLTPHIGGATVESMALTELLMANRLKQFIEGGAAT